VNARYATGVKNTMLTDLFLFLSKNFLEFFNFLSYRIDVQNIIFVLIYVDLNQSCLYYIDI